jgi:hypothetical protein
VVDLNGVHTFGAHVRVVQIVFERKPILMFLWAIAEGISFLATHCMHAVNANETQLFVNRTQFEKESYLEGLPERWKKFFLDEKSYQQMNRNRVWIISIVRIRMLLFAGYQ